MSGPKWPDSNDLGPFDERDERKKCQQQVKRVTIHDNFLLLRDELIRVCRLDSVSPCLPKSEGLLAKSEPSKNST